MTTFNAKQIIDETIAENGYRSSDAPHGLVLAVVTNIEDAVHEVALELLATAEDEGYNVSTVRAAFEGAGLLQPEPEVAEVDEPEETASVEDRLDRIEKAVSDLSALAERHLGSRV